MPSQAAPARAHCNQHGHYQNEVAGSGYPAETRGFEGKLVSQAAQSAKGRALSYLTDVPMSNIVYPLYVNPHAATAVAYGIDIEVCRFSDAIQYHTIQTAEELWVDGGSGGCR